MDMTAPVLVKVPEETKMWEPAEYTLSFPLPSAYQDKPPAPTNDKVSQQVMGEKFNAGRCSFPAAGREVKFCVPQRICV